MSKYIVISVNENADYVYFLPLTVWSWYKIGFEPILLYRGKLCDDHFATLAFNSAGYDPYLLSPIEGIRDATIAQVSRLYVSGIKAFEDDDYIMLGDVDMLALGDHWNPDTKKVTVYNHDLTGFTEIPMCYVGAPKKLWFDIMKLNRVTSDLSHQRLDEAIRLDLENYPNAKSHDFYQWWGCDQQILTQHLKEYGTSKIEFINRGQYSNGYAKGRVDRGAWTLEHEQFIDAHLFQQTHHSEEKIRKTMELLETVWPNEDFQWFRDYTVKFKELAK